MNCREVREKITESFAAGEFELSSDVAAHANACAVCRDFCQREKALFGSLDSGLQVMVSPRVPPSLLPAVRARMVEEPTPRHSWTSGWRFALLAAASILAVSVLLTRHHLGRRDAALVNVRVNRPEAGQPVFATPAPTNVEARRSSPSHGHRNAPVSSETASEAAPEVIVLAEERKAFARFVARLPEDKEVAVALANPAPPRKDIPVEVALLRIDELQVPPLEPKEAE